MADTGQTHTEYPLVEIENLDVTLLSTLQKSGSHSREDIVNEIEYDFDKTTLIQQREKAFHSAKTVFQARLKVAGWLEDNQTIQMELIEKSEVPN